MEHVVTLKDSLSLLVSERFPKGVVAAFAYGSAVFKQQGHEKLKSVPMLDLILVVDSPEEWHEDNVKKNSSDYSFIKLFGSCFVSRFGNMTSAGVLYNPMIEHKGLVFKYGIVSKTKLLDDLTTWKYLYVAGRLHKPVLWIKQDSHLDAAVNTNLESAFLISLLSQPARFNEDLLYRDICNISYNGDIRTYFGLDHNKACRIVKPNIQQFRNLYNPCFNSWSPYIDYNLTNGRIYKDTRVNSLCIQKLPQKFIQKLSARFGVNRARDLYRVETKRLNDAIRETMKSIVFTSSSFQTLKGLFSSSLAKSFKYSKEKFTKAVVLRGEVEKI